MPTLNDLVAAEADCKRLLAALVALDDAGLLKGNPEEYKPIAEAKRLAHEVLSEMKCA